MSRRTLSILALVVLAGLTLLTGALASEGPPLALAAVATVKVAVIGLVWLELGRSWPGWAVLAIGLAATVVFGAALLVG